jgi:anti-anti-sigma factor
MKLNYNSGIVTFAIDPNASVKEYDSIFSELREPSDMREIRADMKDVFFIQSAMLSQLIALKKVADKKNILISLLNVGDGVLHVLEMANLMRFFHISQDYSSYNIDQLIDMFHETEHAELVSQYIASDYTTEYKNAIQKAAISGDSIVQEYALQTIGRAHDQDGIPILREAITSIYPNVARSAILVLGWMGDKESKEQFYQAITTADESVAEAAAAAIALLYDDSDPARFKELARSNKAQMKIIVAGALALMNDDAAFDILKFMLKDEKNESVRCAVIKHIAFFNKDEASELLIRALNDKFRTVQEAAAAGLARTGLRGHDKEVLAKISEEDSWVSYFAVKALGAKLSTETADYLINKYESLEENVRLAVIEVLGAVSTEVVQKFLKDRLKDGNGDVRKEALSSLYASNPQAGTDEALKLVTTDTGWIVRFIAMEIINSARPKGYLSILENIRKNDSNRYIQEKVTTMLGK